MLLVCCLSCLSVCPVCMSVTLVYCGPQFSANLCCGQMAAWIKMSLGMEVGLGAGDFVLDGDPAPLPKGGGARPMFIAAKRLDG